MSKSSYEQTFSLRPIALIQSCFSEKFGIPRQPGLVPEARAILQLLPEFNRPEALKGLEDVSHVWILFVFHQAQRARWKPTVRPPRLGGNRRLGVFATRSPFRPNPVGMSVLRLEGLDAEGGRLELSGVDLLDGTPVLDIKPYLAGVDRIDGTRGGYTESLAERALVVRFDSAALRQCAELENAQRPQLRRLIEQLLRRDPRPGYAGEDLSGKEYGMRLYDLDVKWSVDGDEARVLRLERVAG